MLDLPPPLLPNGNGNFYNNNNNGHHTRTPSSGSCSSDGQPSPNPQHLYPSFQPSVEPPMPVTPPVAQDVWANPGYGQLYPSVPQASPRPQTPPSPPLPVPVPATYDNTARRHSPTHQPGTFDYTPPMEQNSWNPAYCPPLRPSPPIPVRPQAGGGVNALEPVSPAPLMSPSGSGSSGNLANSGSSGHLHHASSGCSIGCHGTGSRPVCFRVRHHVISGVANALSSFDTLGTYDTYTLDLHGIEQFFGAVQQGWNKKYTAAQQIFGRNPFSMALRTAIHAQHASLYCSIVRKESHFRSGMDFLAALQYGIRGGVPRCFTYVILDGKMRFSETGAAFLKDKLSKHAVHSNAMPQVRYAGEFHIQPVANNGARPWLVIDNNSGTYAPDKNMLPRVADLLRFNFPDLQVEALDREDPRYKAYIAELKARK